MNKKLWNRRDLLKMGGVFALGTPFIGTGKKPAVKSMPIVFPKKNYKAF